MKRNKVVSLLREFKKIMVEERAWWIIPILVILLFAALALIVTQSSAVSPFLYALI